MIKLVVTDIDGTLLEEGTDKINTEIYDVVEELKKQGTIFAAASGRQYNSIRHVFSPIANDMIFICENGTNIICRGYDMDATILNKQDARDLIKYIRTLDDCYMTVSSKEAIYVENRDPAFLDLMINGYKNEIRIVDDLLSEDRDILKISIYKESGVDSIAQQTIDDWKDRFRVTVAGGPWLDFMDYQADKGNAIAKIQEILHISKEETMAFGDNHNDIGMLNHAGESYAVANARTAVKEAAKYVAKANTEDGVLLVLKELVEKQRKQKVKDAD
ncbi:MAG: HAD family hydrolase [Hespellia sp.]|nr:HAD family hydrolase [Hespellia sp.]